jgi:hypothetical protein
VNRAWSGRQHAAFYPVWILYVTVGLLMINIGADIGAMGAAVKLLLRGPVHLYCVLFAAISVFLEIRIFYRSYSAFLKWLTFTLFAHIGTLL